MERFAALILAAVTLSAPARAGDSPPEAAPVEGPRILWAEPLTTTLGAAYTAAFKPQDERLYLLSGGYAHPWGQGRALVSDLFLVHSVIGCRQPGGKCKGFSMARASIGLAESFGEGSGQGFLLQPRLILGYLHQRAGMEDPDVFSDRRIPRVQGFTLQAGLDVGYQWRIGSFYLALVGGAAVGQVFRFTEDSAGSPPPEGEDSGWLITPNLVLLRTGWAF